MKTLLITLFTALLIAGCGNSPTETNAVPPGQYKEMNATIFTLTPPDTVDYIITYLTFTLSDSTMKLYTSSGTIKYTDFYNSIGEFAVMSRELTDTLHVSIVDLENREWIFDVINAYYSKNNNKMTFTTFQNPAQFSLFSQRVKLLTIK
jgi:hypothetical protein